MGSGMLVVIAGRVIIGNTKVGAGLKPEIIGLTWMVTRRIEILRRIGRLG